jgi:hypothetical protein
VPTINTSRVARSWSRPGGSAHHRAPYLLPLVGVIVLVVLGSPAFAEEHDQLPDVVGLNGGQAQAKLLDWYPVVLITTQPSADTVPAGTDLTQAFVTEQQLLNPESLDVDKRQTDPPQVRLTVRPKVPNLVGMTLDQAQAAVTARGLVLATNPGPLPPAALGGSPNTGSPRSTVLVQAQQPDPGATVAFGTTVTVVPAKPAAPRASPSPRTIRSPTPRTNSSPSPPRRSTPSPTPTPTPSLVVVAPWRITPTALASSTLLLSAVLVLLLLVLLALANTRPHPRTVTGQAEGVTPTPATPSHPRSASGRVRLRPTAGSPHPPVLVEQNPSIGLNLGIRGRLDLGVEHCEEVTP